LGDLGVDGSRILKWILNNYGVRTWTEFIWLRTESGTDVILYSFFCIPISTLVNVFLHFMFSRSLGEPAIHRRVNCKETSELISKSQ